MIQGTDQNELYGPAWYKIEIAGCLQEEWADWFDEDLVITNLIDPEGFPKTVLTGPVSDQPALRGILNMLWNLNLALIAVNRTPAQRETGDQKVNDKAAVSPERRNEQVDQQPFVGQEVSKNV